MLNKSHITEQEFQEFMKAGFGDIGRLDPRQVTEMRRAFYGGLAFSAFNPEKLKEILGECRDFFNSEIEQYESKNNT